jgi:hypothetical protein
MGKPEKARREAGPAEFAPNPAVLEGWRERDIRRPAAIAARHNAEVERRDARKKSPRKTSPATQRLTADELSADGAVHWPALLGAEQYEAQRAALEAIFARRAELGAALDDADSQKAERQCKELQLQLTRHIDDAKGNEWIAAERFVRKLIGEIRLARTEAPSARE